MHLTAFGAVQVLQASCFYTFAAAAPLGVGLVSLAPLLSSHDSLKSDNSLATTRYAQPTPADTVPTPTSGEPAWIFPAE
jgi:hypothetical protein